MHQVVKPNQPVFFERIPLSNVYRRILCFSQIVLGMQRMVISMPLTTAYRHHALEAPSSLECRLIFCASWQFAASAMTANL